MTTGYVVSGRGDLDGLFMPRTSAADAATGFLSNGGVDLAQRFEPRGATTAIAATNFKSGATDLAQIFKDIAASPPVTDNYTMGAAGGDIPGYFNIAIHPEGVGSWTPSTTFKSWKVSRCYYQNFANTLHFEMYNDAGGAPADSDASYAVLTATGVFTDSAGATVMRTLLRSQRTSTSTGTTSTGSYPSRLWAFAGGGVPQFRFISGNTYTMGLG